jgi:hypothetical protein
VDVADAGDGREVDGVLELLASVLCTSRAANSSLSRTLVRAGICPDFAHSMEFSLR